MVDIGSKTTRSIVDYKLSRYACYLISQTEQKLKKENIKLERKANETHYEVGKEIRNTINKLGGTMIEITNT